jgi:hypothetical protein
LTGIGAKAQQCSNYISHAVFDGPRKRASTAQIRFVNQLCKRFKSL